MSEEVNSAEVEAPEMPQVERSSEPVQLSFADLAAAVQIIDVFVARGAVRGEELTSVGSVRDRLATFVKQAQEQQQEQEAQAEAA